MQFTVENEPFAKALSLVKGCVPPKSTIPILAHVVVEAAEGEVVIRSSNLDRECEARVPAEVSAAGAAALPGEVLAALAKRLPKGGQAAVQMGGDRCKVSSGHSSYDLRALSPEDFPLPRLAGEAATVFQMPADDLRQLIKSTSYALCKSIVKLYFAGSYLHVADGQLRMVATDDHRLALRSVDLPKGAAAMPGVVVPAEAGREILSLLDGRDEDVELAVSASLLEVRLPGLRFATALVECEYPAYERAIPQLNGAAATFRPYALAEAAKRAAVVYLGEASTTKKKPTARILIANDAIKLEAGIPGYEQALEVVEAETVGDDLSFSVNAEYLTEMLAIWPDTVALGVQQGGRGGAVLFAADGRADELHIIMPQKR